MFNTSSYKLTPEDERVVLNQRAITNKINRDFIQVGAIFLKAQSKLPAADDWAKIAYLATDAQAWIDDEQYRTVNMGFNLQFGWTDVDLDSDDPTFNQCIHSAMRHLRIDSRFSFGRRSAKCPSHIFVQLVDEDAANFADLEKFAPKEMRLGNKHHKVELRASIPTASKNVSTLNERSKQTVVPGSIYADKSDVSRYDVSVWYTDTGRIATAIGDVASTTPRRVTYRELVRAVAFGSILFLVQPHWIEGSRQIVAGKLFGWLARLVRECSAISDDDSLSGDIMCPIDSDEWAESLIDFMCTELGDTEVHMRKRTYSDARRKLEQNPDAKIPGWPAIEALIGTVALQAMRSIVKPGSDASPLSNIVDRYLYEEANGLYIDRERFFKQLNFTHEARQLRERHASDIIFINGKPREAFRLYERSKLRVSVEAADTVPDGMPGTVTRINLKGKIVPDDYANESKLVFNAWPGWAVKPTDDPKEAMLRQCKETLDHLLGFLTCENQKQVEWIWKWLAYTIQKPADKQQVAWMVAGGQGTGKSFMGLQFLPKLLGRLAGSTNGKIFGERFSLSPILGKVVVFVDEVRIKNAAALDELKGMIRNSRISGELKGQDASEYNNFARFFLAANSFQTGVRHEDTLDRALYITKAFTPEHLSVSQSDFLSGWVVRQKPFFDNFAQIIERQEILEHFMYILMNLVVSRHELEEVESSSANSAEIIESNLSLTRRRIKDLVEDGRIFEDLHITFPFSKIEFAREMTERFKSGAKPLNADWVFAEMEKLQLLQPVMTQTGKKYRFRWNYADLCKNLSEAIGVKVEARFEFTPDDYGINVTDGSKPIQWRGVHRNKF